MIVYLLHCLCFVNFTASALPQKLGAQNWLIKLNDDEQKFVRDRCYPNSSPVAAPSSQTQERVIGGEDAAKGDYKHAVVFTRTEKNMKENTTEEYSLCTGTLISPRHVVTARHCFGGGGGPPRFESFHLKFGGVCIAKDENECKNGSDMYTAEFDFAIFDSDPAKDLKADFAIAQLKEPIPMKYFDDQEVDIACLPKHRDEFLPDTVDMVGWGEVKHGVKTRQLHYATAYIRADCFENLTITYGFCTFINNTDINYQSGVLPGDSGGGAVHYSNDLKRYVLLGVAEQTINGTNRLIPSVGKSFQRFSRMVALTNYLGDLCYHIGICGAHEHGYFRTLAFGSVYLFNKSRLHYPELKPFKMISDQENIELNLHCEKLREKIIEKYLQGNITPRNITFENGTLVDPMNICDAIDTELQYKWSWNLTFRNDTSGDIHVCPMTAVTTMHFVTTGECVKLALQKLKQCKNCTVFLKAVNEQSDNKPEVELIAYSAEQDYPLAIVQINETQKIDHSFVACMQHAVEVLKMKGVPNPSSEMPSVYFDKGNKIVGIQNGELTVNALFDADFPYGTEKQCMTTAKYICAQPYPGDMPKCANPPRQDFKRLPGNGVIDAIRYAFVGIQLENEEMQKQNWTMYLAAKSFTGTLCIFLNRCEAMSQTFTSYITYFEQLHTNFGQQLDI